VALLLLFAFLGGIILNLMPCVLPVLSLKLFSLIKQAGESRGRLLALGGATTAGILCSFWVLAAVVAAIKAGGGSAGWGMQFQSAGFIAFMVVILTAFAMSFFGVFEIWLPWGATTKMDEAGHKAGFAGAFFTGALLVLLSTPCSAPFLGTAMGFAFTATTPVLFLFFTAAGLGLALPYMLVSAFPKVLKVFPKPGAWMVHLQRVMGVLLFASVAWLLWIVNEQAGSMGVELFAAIVMASIACSVLLGKFAKPGVVFVREVAVIILSVVALFSLWFAAIGPQYENAAAAIFNARMQEHMTEDGWFRYSPALIEEFKKAKRTVFIDVTADWCLTCKANEAAVLDDEDFTRAMDSLNVALVKADWTRETPEVNALLKSMGKSGVPAYAIYPAGNANRQLVLPELLTVDGIVNDIVGVRK
jgi:thiol:disulfide interchange protein DsbD